ncbi:MAG: peptide chain release factor N(5)-glutamine methyltransferase [Ilumatobacteraceae bacterium]
MVTWRELLAETTARVGERTAARWLCEVAASASDGAEFVTMLDEPATERMIAHLDSMAVRLATGEPLQYVLGQWSFRHIEVAIDRRVLIPRPETELVAGVAIDKARTFTTSRTVVDLGTGSGVIGLSLAAELPVDGTTVWMTDRSADALDVARANLAGIGRKGRNVRIGEGRWFDAVPTDLRFDVIVSNPPYVEAASDLDASVVDWEPTGALFAGPDGLDDIRTIVSDSYERLVTGGWLILEIGAGQGRAVRDLLLGRGFEAFEVRQDLAARDRIAIARRPPGPRP